MTTERWEQINRLFESARRLGARERGPYLARECAGDESLRREVESLVASHERAGGFIEEPAVNVAARQAAGRAGGPPLAGRAVAHYRVLSLIGEGGMGEVYLAEDTRLGRKVALKFLPDLLSDDAGRVRRFRREARAASALNHPNIVTVYEIGRADSRHFIAAELIEGETLRQHLSSGGLELGRALDVAIQVASALTAAHEAGITHRDIKPENVMIRRDRIVKVLDFGLAKLTDGPPLRGADERPALTKADTAPGMLMGTAAYMSPEQARSLEVDARTDIWSLGVVLYEMAAGRAPFAGETPADVLSLILQKEPEPLTRYVPAASEELERIVTKALAKDPEGRYQTAKDLLIDLQRLKRRLDLGAELERSARASASADDSAAAGVGRGVTAGELAKRTGAAARAHATSSAEYLVGEVKRHKLWVTLAAAALVAAAVAAYLSTARDGRKINSLAVLPLVNASGNPEAEYLSDGITESLINSLSRLPGLRVMSFNSVLRYKGRGADAREVGRTLGVEAVLTGRVAQRGDGLVVSVELVDVRDNSHVWGERYDRRLSDLLAVQGEISREVLEKLRPRLTGEQERRATRRYTENAEAYKLYLKGRFYWNKRTFDGLKKGVEHFQRALELDPNYALAYSGLADSYYNLSFVGMVPADGARPEVLEAARRAVELDPNLPEARTSLAAAKERFEWDWVGAEREYKRALELNPEYATAHHRYGMFLAGVQGRYDEALAELKRALELDPASLIINADLGHVYYLMRRYDLAIDQLLKTIELDPNFPRSHFYLANCYTQTGRYDEAVGEMQKAAELLGSDSFKGQLGYVYAVAGRRDEALRILAELKEAARGRYVPGGQVMWVYVGLGDKDRAFEYLEKGFKGAGPGLPLSLRADPKFDRMRSDPRFADLLRRMGLPQ